MTITYAPNPAEAGELRALFRENQSDLVRYARRLAGDSAEDLVSSAFEVAVRKMPSRHPHPVGWLFRTVKYLALAEMRRREHERVVQRDHAVIHAAADDHTDEGHLRSLINQLSSPDQEVIQLTYWDELPAAEVSVILGCSEAAVWKRLSRAKARLRKAWEARQEDPTSEV